MKKIALLGILIILLSVSFISFSVFVVGEETNTTKCTQLFADCVSGDAQCTTVVECNPDKITVLSPNGGENLFPGNKYDITWESEGVDKVDIWAIREDEQIACGVCYIGSYCPPCQGILVDKNVDASLGKYSWTIPSGISQGYKFKIQIGDSNFYKGANQIYDESDNYFTISKTCSSNPCDDGTVPNCKISEGICVCETCPPIIVKPVCGNGICESGEGEICMTTAAINKISSYICEEGKECKIPPTVCKIVCPEDCKDISEKIVYANLNEKFKLQVSQVAKIKDYKDMKIVFKDLIAYKCKETEVSSAAKKVIEEKIENAAKQMAVQIIPSSTSAITGNPIKNVTPQITNETKTEILKCIGAGPKALLKINFLDIPTEEEVGHEIMLPSPEYIDKFKVEKTVTLDLGEKKQVEDVTISFLDYDYASRTGVFLVTKEEFSCPEKCKCDKKGNIIECIEEKCSSGQILCPDRKCREKCEIIIPQEECKYGCSFEGKCFPISIRANGSYCGIDLVMSSQKTSEGSCENNFECKSNVCVGGKCVSASLLEKIINWFKKLFGAE